MISAIEMGQKYNKWTTLSEFGRSKSRDVLWLCRCDCGRIFRVLSRHLKSGHSKGCIICAGKYLFIRTHGDGRKKEGLYPVWQSMIARCEKPTRLSYKYYGGRGISVDRLWRQDYQTFKRWALNNNYHPNLQLDRINNDGNYEPTNCRFVSPQVNIRNSKVVRHITIKGKTQLLCDWAKEIGISASGLSDRLQKGWSEDRLLLPSTFRKLAGRRKPTTEHKPGSALRIAAECRL